MANAILSDVQATIIFYSTPVTRRTGSPEDRSSSQVPTGNPTWWQASTSGIRFGRGVGSRSPSHLKIFGEKSVPVSKCRSATFNILRGKETLRQPRFLLAFLI